MSLFIKICGITSAKDASLAVSFGANALGFNMYEKSPRYVSKKEVKEILKELSDEIIPVMVFVDPSFEYVEDCLKLSTKIIPQFHGSENPEFCSSFNRKFFKAEQLSAFLKEEFDLKLRETKNGKKSLVAKLIDVNEDEILFHCGEEKMSLNFLDLDLCRLKPDFEELMRVNK